MINTTILLGFAVLGMKKIQESTQEYWKPSKKDVDELETNTKNLACEIRGGRKQYPFELYLESKDIISFDEFGRWQVKNPLMYDRMNRVESLREWIEEQDRKSIFQQFPEEKAIYQAKLDAITKTVRI